MKKFMSIMLCVCICLLSTVFCFASPTTWDTSDQTNLSNIARTLTTTSTGTILRAVNDIINALTSSTQQGSLYNGVAYLYDIRAALTGNSTGVGSTLSTISSTLGNIWSALSFAVDGQYISAFVARIMTAVESFDTDLNDLKKALTRQTTLDRYNNAQAWLVNPDGTYNYSYLDSNFNKQTVKVPWANGSPIGNLAYIIRGFNDSFIQYAILNHQHSLIGYNSNQNVVNWGSLDTSTFTPSSAIDGIYKYLNTIQAPVSRLAYVLANDQEIAARDKAAANQTAVVDNFIDSSGSGAAAPSDFGSLSDLSSGFKDNIATDASVSGIWNIFNSDNFGWFSQETADQLDTSESTSRSLRSSGSYPTPLLDQQTEEILNYLGGNNND